MQQFSILSLLRTCWIHKVGILAGWVLLTLGAAVIVMKLPPVYTAEALILVESQKIPERLVPSTVSSDIQDRLATISQEILSTPRLQKIIDDFGLYRNERQDHVPEEILQQMRTDITTKVERGWSNNKPGAFRVGYSGPEPAVVAQVANRIANLYIEENLRTREVQAEGTSEFLKGQLEDAEKRLNELEAKISEYKLKHNGELPEQAGAITVGLNRLQNEQNNNREAILRGEETKAMLENTLRLAQATLDTLSQRVTNVAAAPAETRSLPVANQLQPAAPPKKPSEILEAQLEQLRSRYGDAHPEVKRMRQEVSRAKAAEAAAAKAASAPVEQPLATKPESGNTEAAGVPSKAFTANAAEVGQARERIETLKSQIQLTENDMERRKAEQQAIARDLNLTQARLAAIPLREQEMQQVTRDLESARANYRSLLDKAQSAEMSTDMERRQKSERFTIIDPARIPGKPFKPNRPFFLLLGSGCGFVISLALFIGQEIRKDRLLGEWELPSGINILARVPEISIDRAQPSTGAMGSGWKVGKRVVLAGTVLLVVSLFVARYGHVVARYLRVWF